MADRNLALNLLIKAKDLASSVVKSFGGTVKESSAEADKLSSSLDDAGTATGHFADKLSEADKAAGRFYDKAGRLREASGRFVEGAKRAQEQTQALGGQLDGIPGAADRAGRGIGGLTTKIIALAGTYLGINALQNAISGLINTGSRFEDMQVQINTLMGSIEEGQKAVAWIKDFASTTPADIEGVTQGFIKLKAFGIDPMNGSYQAIVDQTSKLGFSQEKMEGIVLAVGQAWTKQKLQGEEALQLIERGVPVWDLLAKATGRTAVELQNMASNGELGRKEIALLIEEMGKSSAGASAEAMKTWTGLVSNMKDMWLNFVNDISQSGFLDYMKEQLQALLNQAKALAADGTLKRWAKEISDSLIGLAENIKAVAKWIGEWSTQLGYLAGAITAVKLAGWIKDLGLAVGKLKAATTATAGLAGATEGLAAAQAKAAGGWGWLGKAGTGLKNLGGYLVSGGRLLTGIGALAAGVKLIADNWRDAQKAEADALAATQQRGIDALDQQRKHLDAMNTQVKTEDELKRISKEGYEAYQQRLQNAQTYWQARVAEEQAEIELGRNRYVQMLEAQAQLEKYKAAQEQLGQVITNVNTLQSQNLQQSTDNHQQQTDQTNERLGQLTDLQAFEQQLASDREAQAKAQQDAWSALGLTMEEVTGKVTEQGQKSADAFATLVEQGDYTAEQLTEAFDAALAKTRTKADVEALIKVLEAARKKGDLTGDSFKKAFDAAGDKIKQMGNEAKDATNEVDDLGKSMEGAAKAGTGSMTDLIKEVRELVKEVGKLAEGFKKAGDEAEKMADKAGQTGTGDNQEQGAAQGKKSTRSMSQKVADRLSAQGRADAAQILMQNIAKGDTPNGTFTGLSGWNKWWEQMQGSALEQADAVKTKYDDLARYQRDIAAGDINAAKSLLANRNKFADLEADLVGIVTQASNLVSSQPPRTQPGQQVQQPPSDEITVKFDLNGRQFPGTFARSDVGGLLDELASIASISK